MTLREGGDRVRRSEAIRAAALLALGLAQMFGDLVNSPAIRAIAAATNASPAPRVFTAVRGLETFSTAFYIDWEASDGRRHSQAITSDLYANLAGPYNRRNIYGAVFAFGPVMATNPSTAPMFDSILRSSLCGDGHVLRELGSIRIT